MLILFLLDGALRLSAQNCDTLAKPLAKHEKDYQRYNEKVSLGKEIPFKKINTILGVADYLRLKGDAAYKKWYQCAEEMFRERFYYRKSEFELKAKALYDAGRCYFYLERYPEAAVFFSKAIRAKHPGTCATYYLEKSKQGIQTGK